MDKRAVVDVLLSQVRDELAGVERMTAAARDEATSPESRPENKYDTRATEASYLAVGQGQRMAALRRLVAFLETRPDELALIEVADARGPAWFLRAPDGGGRRVTVDGVDVVVVTVESPVGAALAGAEVGDTVTIGVRVVEVVAAT